MLVLTRKPSEGIRLPDLGILIQLVSASRGKCRLGIEAPGAFRIMRSELEYEPSMESLQQALNELPRELRHDLRNEINALFLGIQIVDTHLQRGDATRAAEATEMLKHQIKELCHHPSLHATAHPKTDAPALDFPSVADSMPRPDRKEPTRALLVEDNANERQLMAELLKQSGISIDTAESAEAARAWLATHQESSFVITDMGLPGEGGASLVRHIRSDPSYSQLRIFGVSGTTPDENGLDHSHVDGWFMKPLNVESLVSAVRESLASAA